jgi:hypothetical protein
MGSSTSTGTVSFVCDNFTLCAGCAGYPLSTANQSAEL